MASALIVVALLALWSTVASAATLQRAATSAVDFSYGTGAQYGGNGTAHKPESKLFYTSDGTWWSVLGIGTGASVPGVDTQGVYLFELVNGAWTVAHDEGGAALRFPGSDSWMKADTIFDAATSTLYVSLRDNRSITGNPRESVLYEYSYIATTSTWTRLSGPTVITTALPETLTIARDGAGRLWATYRTGTTVKVGYTDPGGTTFTFSTVSVTAVTTDDISSVVAFGDDGLGHTTKIGVMWSDQNAKQFYFAWRDDSDPLGSPLPWHRETAYGAGVGGCPTATSDHCADDHISLRADGDDVYAAVKTSLNDPPCVGCMTDPNDPLLVLLARDGSTGQWSASPFSSVGANASRPCLVISPEQGHAYVVAELDFHGSYLWTLPLSTAGFASSASPQAWTLKGTANVGDPTATKQPVTAATGVVVETSLGGTAHQYFHNALSIP